MDQRSENKNKLDEVTLPGFRFHPTDEELVGFYLKRKIEQRPLSIELIKQLDIYKYDPWDLPKLAPIGEKEWYFYCPRDRKYRNSARPNRVAGDGFWKATGTDRPIYNPEGSKCIGLKKSLVFYKGRAAKGIKTEWMMHEFRLPSTTDHSSVASNRFIHKDIPANDAWAIRRIFKKTNTTAQRALSHSWVSRIIDGQTSEMLTHNHVQSNTTQLLSVDNFSLPTKTNSTFHFPNSFYLDKLPSHANFSPPNIPTPYDGTRQGATATTDFTRNYTLSSESSKATTMNDASSLLLNMSSSIFGDFGNKVSQNMEFKNVEGLNSHCGVFSLNLPQAMLENSDNQGEIGTTSVKDPNIVLNLEDQLGSIRSIGFPYGLPLSLPDVWKTNLVWDSSSPCPSTQISTTSLYT